MPFSSDSGKQLIDRAILRINHQISKLFYSEHRVLDFGAGSGTYSDRYAKSHLPRPKFHWEGIEIWEPYVAEFGLLEKYDKLHVAHGQILLTGWRAPNWLSPCPAPIFDIIFLGDVIEHLPKDGPEGAVKLIKNALGLGRLVIVSVPLGHYPQDEYNGNPYEAHLKDDWTHEEFMECVGEHVVSWGREAEIGIYFLSSTPFVKELLHDVLKPQIAVYGICKNESKFIKRCYESIQEADFIVFCDTGSSDETFTQLVRFVEERTESHGHERDLQFHYDHSGHLRGASTNTMRVVKLHVDPWRFDDARNAALCLVPEDIDMCVSIDADELMDTPNWRELLIEEIEKDLQEIGRPRDRYHHRFESIWDWHGAGTQISSHWHERIHNRHGYQWKLPVHEVLVKINRQAEIIKWLGGIKMVQKPDPLKDRSTYLPLLEQALREDSTRWKLYSFYAADLLKVGRFDDALRAYEKALECPNADRGFLHAQVAGAFQTAGALNDAAQHMVRAIAESPASREYKTYAARIYKQAGMLAEARSYVMQAEQITHRPSSYHYDPSCWGEAFEQLKQEVNDSTQKS